MIIRAVMRSAHAVRTHSHDGPRRSPREADSSIANVIEQAYERSRLIGLISRPVALQQFVMGRSLSTRGFATLWTGRRAYRWNWQRAAPVPLAWGARPVRRAP